MDGEVRLPFFFMSVNTKLRFISAKKPETLILWVNSLPYKIEIKGNAVFNGGLWFLYFVLPDTSLKEVPSGRID